MGILRHLLAWFKKKVNFLSFWTQDMNVVNFCYKRQICKSRVQCSMSLNQEMQVSVPPLLTEVLCNIFYETTGNYSFDKCFFDINGTHSLSSIILRIIDKLIDIGPLFFGQIRVRFCKLHHRNVTLQTR